jgi:NAD-dependent dihydropyrimidine dehydrogenase PreA subunit
MMLGKLNIELADSIRPELWARVEQLLASGAARKPAGGRDCAEGCPLARGPGGATYDVRDRRTLYWRQGPVVCGRLSGRLHLKGDDQLYIEPDECIDCGACVPECPVTAIFTEEEVPPNWKSYIAKNRDVFKSDQPPAKRTPEKK